MSSITSVGAQREVGELKNYVENQQQNFKTKSLVEGATEDEVAKMWEKKKTLDAQLGRIMYTLDGAPVSPGQDTKKAQEKYGDAADLQISDAGKARSENARTSQLAYIQANAREAVQSDYREYGDALEEASAGFQRAYSTQKIGKYVDSGIKSDEVDYSYIKRLNDTYDKLKEKIEAMQEGEEKTYRLGSLDKYYAKAMQKNIIAPILGQYHSQTSFYQNGVGGRQDKQMAASYQGLSDAGNLAKALQDSGNWHHSDRMQDLAQKLTNAIVTNAASK